MNWSWVRVKVSEDGDEMGAGASTIFTPTSEKAEEIAPTARWSVVDDSGAVVATADRVAETLDAPEFVALLHPLATNVNTTTRPVVRVNI